MPVLRSGRQREVAGHRPERECDPIRRGNEVRIGGTWRSVERIRETRSFDLWDHDGSLTVDTTDGSHELSAGDSGLIPVGMTHYMMLRRNLIYTGVTRGKKLVVLVGQRKAVGIAVR